MKLLILARRFNRKLYHAILDHLIARKDVLTNGLKRLLGIKIGISNIYYCRVEIDKSYIVYIGKAQFNIEN